MAALYHLCPQFLYEERLCWLYSPLYIVSTKTKDYYYFSDEEFEKNTIKGNVTRAKGLGALSEEKARESMFGENQRLEIIKVNDEGISLLADLMGEKVEPRKDFIFTKIDFNEIKE